MGINLTELANILPFAPMRAILSLEAIVGDDEDTFLEDEDFKKNVTGADREKHQDEFVEDARAFAELAEGQCSWASQKLVKMAGDFCALDESATWVAQDIRAFLIEFLAELTDSKSSWIEAMLKSSPQASSTDLTAAQNSQMVDWNDAIFSGMRGIVESGDNLQYESENLDVSFHHLPKAGVTVVFATTLTERFGMDGFRLTRSAFSFLKASKVGEDHLQACETIAGSTNTENGDVDAFCESLPIDFVVDHIDARRSVMRIHSIETNNSNKGLYLCKLLPATAYPDYIRARGSTALKPMGEVYVLWSAERVRSDKTGRAALKLSMGLFFKADPFDQTQAERAGGNSSAGTNLLVRQFYSLFMMPKMYSTYEDGVERFSQARARLVSMS